MLSVLDACKPRPEILAGTFNPEVFTASLAPIIEYYRTGRRRLDNVYTDASLFFGQATYPTQGLRTTLNEVFARIAGSFSVPAIHRLETAFGGGKTHTLIACTHIAFKGRELQDVTADLIDPSLLPEPGSVSVVGIAGDEIPVHKPQGEALVPYTLWGEIAYQIGGEELYAEVEAEATSYAAPGRVYFDKVFGGRKVLIMLDELAQYAARLEAARPDGASQLSAFLMSLHGYARNNPGIAIVLTLASATDAFSRQTERLAQLIGQVRGEEVSEDDALSIGEHAVRSVASVVARDAVQIIPVHGTEIASVLAKRLFESIDRKAAEKTADAYMEMYRRNSEALPDAASSDGFRERMIANYPFHPTLVDFLNQKLAVAENFQGTRGVLRVLALAVRSLWEKKHAVPMIHTCHLDLRSDRVVNEILGRTGSSDLLFVLNADVGSVDTGSLEGGRSNAEVADERNPHPEGYPMHEYAWKTVFLHSLVGRSEGLESNIFGLTESEALFSTSFPGLTPPQVLTALKEIANSAFYLRYEQGKYFASEEPTINSVLARIRRSVSTDEVREVLEQTARKVVSPKGAPFHVEHDVSAPEHIPDNTGKPVLGVVSLNAESIDVEAMITTAGMNRPRVQQNLVILLVPETVSVKGDAEQVQMLTEYPIRALEAKQRLEGVARQVRALRLLAANPQRYGVNPAHLDTPEFKERSSERENALLTEVAGVYTRFFYPSAQGRIVWRDIRTAGGEGGTPFFEQIRASLIEEGELLTSENTTHADLLNMQQILFQNGDVISLKQALNNFLMLRSWPMLESQDVLEQIVRAGVQRGSWCVFKMGEGQGARPDEFYHQQNEVPMSVSLLHGGYSLVTVQGAKQRGWTEPERPTVDVRRYLLDYMEKNQEARMSEVSSALIEQDENITPQDVQEAARELIRDSRLMSYRGDSEHDDKPDLLYGNRAIMYTPDADDVLVLPKVAEEKGWIDEDRGLDISGAEAVERLQGLVHRLGSMYTRGATTTIELLGLEEIILPDGGMLTVRLEDVTPESMKALGELFEVLGNVLRFAELRHADIRIADADDNCPLVQELKKE